MRLPTKDKIAQPIGIVNVYCPSLTCVGQALNRLRDGVHHFVCLFQVVFINNKFIRSSRKVSTWVLTEN